MPVEELVEGKVEEVPGGPTVEPQWLTVDEFWEEWGEQFCLVYRKKSKGWDCALTILGVSQTNYMLDLLLENGLISPRTAIGYRWEQASSVYYLSPENPLGPAIPRYTILDLMKAAEEEEREARDE